MMDPETKSAKLKGQAKATTERASDSMECSWSISDVLADLVQCDPRAVESVVRLLDEDNSVPFIARYRKEQTNFLELEKLREIKENLDELREVQSKVVKVLNTINKQGQLDECIKSSIQDCKTLDDIDHLYAPFKPGGKRTLSDRAKDLGLDQFANLVLSSGSTQCLRSAVDAHKEGLMALSDVEQGVQHILADKMAKDIDVLDSTRQFCRMTGVKLHSKLIIKSSKSSEKVNTNAKVQTGASKLSSSKTNVRKCTDSDNFQIYHDFSAPISIIKPHQVMAINRGENQKVLRVAVMLTDNIRTHFICRSVKKNLPVGAADGVQALIQRSAEDAYDRLVLPFLTRSFRGELTKKAVKASVDVFASNLKKLLLTPPVRGKAILGLDPGFINGCKFALISATGKVKETGVAYLHKRNVDGKYEVEKLKRVLLLHRCETVAIGNGVACRETEQVLSDAIRAGVFYPLAVMFCIVNEAGASIYSASKEAEKELPDLDVTVRGAVSIARRLQDSLAELVKIEPKSIGVGMYQHDINEKQLKTALDGVIEDAVGLVGANLNVASEALLRHISGVSEKLAAKIIDYRNTKGPFSNRSQLMNIPFIRQKTFEQCAGFLRILPTLGSNEECDNNQTDTAPKTIGKKRKGNTGETSASNKRQKLDVSQNLFDATWIHPESYDLAERLLAKAGLTKDSIGQSAFISSLRMFISEAGYESLAESMQTTVATLKQVADGLCQSIDADVRDDYDKPLFRRCVTSLNDITVGSTLSGSVVNVTHFGTFVDVGVGQDGLIHVSAIRRNLLPKGRTTLEIGDRVETRVKSIDVDRKRISLELLGMMK